MCVTKSVLNKRMIPESTSAIWKRLCMEGSRAAPPVETFAAGCGTLRDSSSTSSDGISTQWLFLCGNRPKCVFHAAGQSHSSATHLVMPTWIGVQMATITTAAVIGSMTSFRLDSPSIRRTESTSPKWLEMASLHLLVWGIRFHHPFSDGGWSVNQS